MPDAPPDGQESLFAVSVKPSGAASSRRVRRRVRPDRSLAACAPELVGSLHPTRNGDLTADNIPAGSHTNVWWWCPVASDHEWEAAPRTRIRLGTGCPCCANQRVSVTNSLASLHPDLAGELDIEATGRTAEQIIAGSGKKVAWWCPVADDHSWWAVVSSRTGPQRTGCPACAGKQPSVTNSLATLFPAVAAQYDPGPDDPPAAEIVAGTHDKIPWCCPAGPDHRWVAQVKSRTYDANGCPYCANQRVSVTNCLATVSPGLAAELDPEHNPEDVTRTVHARSKTSLWWRCLADAAHRYEATVANRAAGGGCPYCSNHRLSATNSLASRFPAVAAELDVAASGGRTGEQLQAGSHEVVAWRCPVADDHRWRASVVARTSPRGRAKAAGCPACAGRQLSVTNNLARLFPTVAAEYDQEANGGVPAEQVLAGTHDKVAWRCLAGPDHQWQASVRSRTYGGNGCPYCAGLLVSVTNSLAARFPAVAVQFVVDPGEPAADQVVAGSQQRRRWRCPVATDHEWEATVVSRTRLGAGCPACAGRQASVTNSLAELFPDVAVELDPERNGNLTAFDLPARSGRKCWWRCRVNPAHVWEAVVSSRTRQRTGCPQCYPGGHSVQELLLAFEVRGFVAFDVDQHKLQLDDDIVDIDIIVPALELVVEFDGAFWHQGWEPRDAAKAARLRQAGWRVIRVRESPLKRLHPDDVVVPKEQPLAAAIIALRQIERVCGVAFDLLAAYEATGELVNEERARAHAAQLRRDGQPTRPVMCRPAERGASPLLSGDVRGVEPNR
jgi:hypothetical protein